MDKETKFFLQKLVLPVIISLIIIAVTYYHLDTDNGLTRFGVFPRSLDGFIGIFTSPLVHSSWKHFFSNLFPLFTTIILIEIFYPKVSRFVLVIGYLITGLLVWMFAGKSYHIGASGVVYAYISFIFWSGIFKKNVTSIVLSLLVLVVYGGYFDGLKPQEGVSWESHLLGSIVGIVLGFILKGIDDEKEEIVENLQSISRERFLPADAFVYTKEDRARMVWEAEQERLRQEEMRRLEQLGY